IYIMPSTPLISSSNGTARVSAIVSGVAPGYSARTTTVGGVMSGYWATGRVNAAMAPMSTITNDNTVAKMGRSTKKCGNFTGYLLGGIDSQCRYSLCGQGDEVGRTVDDFSRRWLVFLMS